MYLALACVAHSLGCAGETSAGPVPGISRPKMIASGPGSGQAAAPQETEVKIGIRSGIHGWLRTLLKMVSDVHALGGVIPVAESPWGQEGGKRLDAGGRIRCGARYDAGRLYWGAFHGCRHSMSTNDPVPVPIQYFDLSAVLWVARVSNCPTASSGGPLTVSATGVTRSSARPTSPQSPSPDPLNIESLSNPRNRFLPIPPLIETP